MTSKLFALVLLCLMTGTAIAEEPKVTSLMSKDLPESPGREALMITVEHAPGGSSAIHRHNAHAFVYVLEGSVVMQLKGRQQVTLTPWQCRIVTALHDRAEELFWNLRGGGGNFGMPSSPALIRTSRKVWCCCRNSMTAPNCLAVQAPPVH